MFVSGLLMGGGWQQGPGLVFVDEGFGIWLRHFGLRYGSMLVVQDYAMDEDMEGDAWRTSLCDMCTRNMRGLMLIFRIDLVGLKWY